MSEAFGKGTRVRVAEGDHEGVVGEIFWWGRSKYGNELRAGVEPDEGDEKVWVMAKELVAVDEDGNDLDPQPSMTIASTAAKVAIRGISVPYAIARNLTAARIERGVPPGKAARAVLRLENLNHAEEALGCRIPDPIIAYVLANIGEGRGQIGELVGLTAELHDADDLTTAPNIAFENDNGNYLVFARGAKADDGSYQLLDHEESYESGPFESIEERVVRLLGRDEKSPSVEPMEVVIDYSVKEEEPDEPEEQWITHKKFGRGRVLSAEPSRKGDKLKIEFEDGETRKLLDSFIEYE